jgi:hypothetical protein
VEGPFTDRIFLRPSADALADSRALLAPIIGTLRSNAAARLLFGRLRWCITE